VTLVAHLTQFVLGLIILAGGAELFIRGAVRVARRLGVSPFVIGLTLVGFGTSAPELVVNLSAVLSDAPGLAIGNIVGANIANVGLILGLAAVISPLTAQMRLLKAEVPAVIAASLALWIMAANGVIDRIDGAILLGGFVAMVVYVARTARREAPEVQEEFGHLADRAKRTWVSVLMVLVGIAGLGFGADLMVDAAVEVAEGWGVSKEVIGLTVVAVGTTLPELASTLAAAYRGEGDIALGNVVGSNLFNLLLILGTMAQVSPLRVDESLRLFDLPVMVGFAVVLLIVMATGLRVHRWEGVVLVLAYIGFIASQVFRAM
jgi:cation:H+ antiporter